MPKINFYSITGQGNTAVTIRNGAPAIRDVPGKKHFFGRAIRWLSTRLGIQKRYNLATKSAYLEELKGRFPLDERKDYLGDVEKRLNSKDNKLRARPLTIDDIKKTERYVRYEQLKIELNKKIKSQLIDCHFVINDNFSDRCETTPTSGYKETRPAPLDTRDYLARKADRKYAQQVDKISREALKNVEKGELPPTQAKIEDFAGDLINKAKRRAIGEHIQKIYKTEKISTADDNDEYSEQIYAKDYFHLRLHELLMKIAIGNQFESLTNRGGSGNSSKLVGCVIAIKPNKKFKNALDDKVDTLADDSAIITSLLSSPRDERDEFTTLRATTAVEDTITNFVSANLPPIRDEFKNIIAVAKDLPGETITNIFQWTLDQQNPDRYEVAHKGLAPACAAFISELREKDFAGNVNDLANKVLAERNLGRPHKQTDKKNLVIILSNTLTHDDAELLMNNLNVNIGDANYAENGDGASEQTETRDLENSEETSFFDKLPTNIAPSPDYQSFAENLQARLRASSANLAPAPVGDDNV